MGLLDDAIREHLELKRLRGADPDEVAREQREVLDADLAGAAPGGDAQTAEEGVEPAHADAESLHDAEPAGGVQETAELDMQVVLDEHDGEPDVDVTPAQTPGVAAGHEQAEEDSLEWETPKQQSESALEESPDR